MLEWEPFGCGPGFVVGTGRALVRGREGGSYPAAGLRGGGPCVGTAACGDLGGPVPVRGGALGLTKGSCREAGGLSFCQGVCWERCGGGLALPGGLGGGGGLFLLRWGYGGGSHFD